MTRAVLFWQDDPSVGVFVICLVAILVPAFIVILKLLLRHRINLCDAAARQTDADSRKTDADTRRFDAETDRMDLMRAHDRLDRLVAGQAVLPFVEVDDLLRASPRRGRTAPSIATPPDPVNA